MPDECRRLPETFPDAVPISQSEELAAKLDHRSSSMGAEVAITERNTQLEQQPDLLARWSNRSKDETSGSLLCQHVRYAIGIVPPSRFRMSCHHRHGRRNGRGVPGPEGGKSAGYLPQWWQGLRIELIGTGC